jgi:hypothetical protein
MDKIERHVFIKGAVMGALAFTVGGVAFCSRCDLRPVAARRRANGGELEHGGRLIPPSLTT